MWWCVQLFDSTRAEVMSTSCQGGEAVGMETEAGWGGEGDWAAGEGSCAGSRFKTSVVCQRLHHVRYWLLFCRFLCWHSAQQVGCTHEVFANHRWILLTRWFVVCHWPNEHVVTFVLIAPYKYSTASTTCAELWYGTKDAIAASLHGPWPAQTAMCLMYRL